MYRFVRVLFSLCLLSAAVSISPPAFPCVMAVGSSEVKVVREGDGSFTYIVNGEPQVLVGMGYNVMYRYLPTEVRAARYDADFSRLRGMGVNMITGWDADKGFLQDAFDTLTLDKAWEHGLGVIMPFYLPREGDYQDQHYRERMKNLLAQKVLAYKDHPALRMWGIGNEVIEGVIASEQVESFAQFYRELAETAHALDPHHPVIYREAEAVYLDLLTWYTRENAVEDPWLLYGMNFYTLQLGDVLDQWPTLSYGMPVVVSEFAPVGWSHEERPMGYAEMWEMIRADPDYVLGGAPYVWAQEGPEPVDTHFGLVDGDGNPADGSLLALAAEFSQVNR